jgi:hypothetical protein
MTAVRKRSGTTESFDRSKIARSLHNVGVDEKTASEVAALVQEREGMTTDDIRTAVSAELRRRDPKMAEGYEATRRMPARAAVGAAQGMVRMSEDYMRSLNITPGSLVEVRHSTGANNLRLERAAEGARGLHVNEHDMRAMGLSEGAPVAVRKAT